MIILYDDDDDDDDANIPKVTPCECILGECMPRITLTLNETLNNHTRYTYSLSFGE